MPNEFELIQRYFEPLNRPHLGVSLGMGDDAAMLAIKDPVVITMDTLVAGRHFLQDDPAFTLGVKALAVNLSDLAAMGATPDVFLLSLTVPDPSEAWLADFSKGLASLADLFNVSLIGGDTCKGPLSITITAIGHAENGQSIKRSGARVGDDIYVTGKLGAAALRVRLLSDPLILSPMALASCITAYQVPHPRVQVGKQLVGVATACIDLSDGLSGDLGHVLKASACGAVIDVNAMPLAMPLAELPIDDAQKLALCGGDDYELCFTAPASARETINQLSERCDLPITRIGVITDQPGELICQRGHEQLNWNLNAWKHF